MTQRLSLDPQAYYTLRFWLEIPTAQVPATFTVSIDSWTAFRATAADAAQYAFYTPVNVFFYAANPHHTLRFTAVTKAGPGMTSFFVDDVEVERYVGRFWGSPTDVPWLSVFPDQGTLEPAGAGITQTITATVTLNTSGLDLGIYHGHLCVFSNDRHTDRILIPVRMEVFRHPNRTHLPLLMRK